MGFFHFDSTRPEKRAPFGAIRAVIIQLIHKNQLALDIIDTLSVLMDTSGSGQPHASDDEVREILVLIIHRMSGIALVFDGIDECTDASGFLRVLHEICNNSTCRILLFGRPNVSFPAPYRQDAIQFQVEPWSNLEDLKQYLGAEVRDLLETVNIAGALSAENIANLIADRAKSMFLFAKLMVAYLHSPALSPVERLRVIENLSMLEGLDNMYEHTTQHLETRFSKERELVHKIFRLIAVSIRPLTVAELRVALALNPGIPSDESDWVADFERSLPLLCGALVEVRIDKTVQFVHLSVREFLTSKAAMQAQKN